MTSTEMEVLKSYFDEHLYLELYSDVANAEISPWEHFVRHGIGERRVFSRIASPDDIVSKYDTYTAETISLFLLENLEDAEKGNICGLEFKKKYGAGHINCASCKEISKRADKHRLDMISKLYKPVDVILFACEKINDLQFDLDNELSVRDYICMYPDIKQAAVNAFFHYYVAGRFEGRKNKLSTSVGKANEFLNLIQKGNGNVKSSIVLLSKEDVVLKLKSINKDKLFIIVSHDNPFESLGGIQQVLLKEFDTIIERGNSFVHLFPEVPKAAFDDSGENDISIGVLLNGELLGFAMMSTFIRALSETINSSEELRIHHLFGLNGYCLKLLLEIFCVRRIFILHDHSFLCDGYHLLRNGMEYCGAPVSTSAKCKFCVYGTSREQRSGLLGVLGRLGFEFSAPSQSIIAVATRANAKVGKKIKLIPHWKLSPEHNHISTTIKKVNVAYCGFPAFHKGYDLYVDCVFSTEDMDVNYFFLGVERPINLPDKVKFIGVKSNHVMSMTFKVELIRRDIHVVVMPSRCPESFGFIAHEAVSAGCTLIVSDEPYQPVSVISAGGEIVIGALNKIDETLKNTINGIKGKGFARRTLNIEFQHSYLDGDK